MRFDVMLTATCAAAMCSIAASFSSPLLPQRCLQSAQKNAFCSRGSHTFQRPGDLVAYGRADRSRLRVLPGVRGAKAMFTGIVEEMGTVSRYVEDQGNQGVTMAIKCSTVTQGAYEGCSIAVNGVGVSPETLRLTNLGDLRNEGLVNLERAAAIDGRNSGHMVQGHIDNVGEIIQTWPDQESLFFKVRAPQELMRYIVPKGFIAVDGTSLTVCETNVAENWFTFMLVDYTQKHVIIPKKPIGAKVNLEVDVLSKYVERSMGGVSQRLDAIEVLAAPHHTHPALLGLGHLSAQGHSRRRGFTVQAHAAAHTRPKSLPAPDPGQVHLTWAIRAKCGSGGEQARLGLPLGGDGRSFEDRLKVLPRLTPAIPLSLTRRKRSRGRGSSWADLPVL